MDLQRGTKVNHNGYVGTIIQVKKTAVVVRLSEQSARLNNQNFANIPKSWLK